MHIRFKSKYISFILKIRHYETLNQNTDTVITYNIKTTRLIHLTCATKTFFTSLCISTLVVDCLSLTFQGHLTGSSDSSIDSSSWPYIFGNFPKAVLQCLAAAIDSVPVKAIPVSRKTHMNAWTQRSPAKHCTAIKYIQQTEWILPYL